MHQILQASSLKRGFILQETAFQAPADHSHDLSALRLLKQGRQTTLSDQTKLSQDMHTVSELEQSKAQKHQQQAAVERYATRYTRMVRCYEFREFHHPRDSTYHQNLQDIGSRVR